MSEKRILIVEDNREMQHILRVVLDEDEREIVVAGTGKEGQAALEQTDFDLVVLDLILPDMDGRSILSAMRRDPRTATVPVVVVSAQTVREVRQECYDLGADRYVEKPFDPREIAADVTVRLARSDDRERVAFHDPLTGLLNVAGLTDVAASLRGVHGLVLLQIDGFASIVEEWGWKDAEQLLVASAKSVEAGAGEARVIRVGGGEFAILAELTELDEVYRLGETVLDALRATELKDPTGEVFTVTASIGVVVVDGEAPVDESMEAARRRLYQAREAGGNRVASKEREDDERKPSILVAEDDEISATLLMHRLQKDGVEITRYDNGLHAYEAALEATPDLVILDVKMPGMEGFEILEKLRAMHSYSKIPIILVTSMGSEADVVRGFQLGCDDYILKPFSPVELSARVWRLLRNGRSAPAA